MKELIGKTVKRLRVSEDQGILAFDTDQGIVAYETDADCCSETWFADILGIKELIGGTVTGVEELDMPEHHMEDSRSRQDYDVLYGWRLKLRPGSTEIIFRNSSNGYYGGSIALREGTLPENMKDISAEWNWQA